MYEMFFFLQLGLDPDRPSPCNLDQIFKFSPAFIDVFDVRCFTTILVVFTFVRECEELSSKLGPKSKMQTQKYAT